MPIYEYRCRACGKEFELMQKISEAPRRTCVYCKGRASRLISQTAFQLKGSGWYVTDYVRKKGNEAKKSDTKAASKTDDGKPVAPKAEKNDSKSIPSCRPQ